MTDPAVQTEPLAPSRVFVRAGWLVAAALVVLGLVRAVRHLYRAFRDDPECQATVAWFTGSTSLWGIFAHLSASGFTWQSAGAFFGGLGTFFLGSSSLLRELRGYPKPPSLQEQTARMMAQVADSTTALKEGQQAAAATAVDVKADLAAATLTGSHTDD